MSTPSLPPLQLLVFDSRRGNQEGTEDDKVLAAFPNRSPIEEQSSLAGLLQGLLLFSSTFGQKAGWDIAETDKCTWVLHEAEPHIWFAAAATKACLPRHSTEDSLRALLLQTHMLTTLLCGTVQSLLDQDDTAITAQEMLLPVLQYVGRQLANTASWLHRELRNPLSPGASYPLLPLSPAAALTLQTCSNRMLLDTVDGGTRPVQELAVLFGQQVLWTSLLPADMAALYCLLAAALLSSGGSASTPLPNSSSRTSLLENSTWQLLPSGFMVQRSSLEGAVTADEAAVIAPVVHLSASQRWVQVLPLVEGRLLVVLLLDPGTLLSSGLLAQLHQALAAPSSQLAAQVAEDLRASRTEAGHVPGYRFLSEQVGSCSAQATPRDKISATSHHARALAAGLRDSLSRVRPSSAAAGLGEARLSSGSLHRAVTGVGAGSSDGLPALELQQPEQREADNGSAASSWHVDAAPREVLVKSSQDVWAAATSLLPERRLLVVRERRTERSLADFSSRVGALCDALL